MNKQQIWALLCQILTISQAILLEETGKDLPSNLNNNDILSRKRIPLLGGGGGGGGTAGSGCNFKGGRRPYGTGRTFFDLQFVNVGYHQNYNINCGGGAASHPVGPVSGGIASGSGGLGILDGHKPHGNKHKPGLLQALFGGQSQSQSQSHTQSGILGDTLSSFASLLPKPQDIGQGLGDGISSFIQTIPQIGQSFQSLLPTFDNFQLPNLPSFPPITQAGSQSQSQSSAISGGSAPSLPATSPPSFPSSIVTPAPLDPVTEPTVDPDDIIYNDENVKPVHEDPDVVPGFNGNKLPPGAYRQKYAQNRYQSYKFYRDQQLSAQANHNRYHYQHSTPFYGQREPRVRDNVGIFSENDGLFEPTRSERLRSRFRFPT